MARAGMTKWRSTNCSTSMDGSDEVQKSLDVLDRVLSEFDDIDSSLIGTVERSQSAPSATVSDLLKGSVTPDDESPSGLGGHQSEDDGYMSMNGRRAKFMVKPSTDNTHINNTLLDYPPPPEEAERIISTLLPRVSPYNSAQKSNGRSGRDFLNNITSALEETAIDKQEKIISAATQTTLPKTKHQRPYGWQNEEMHHRNNTAPSTSKFGSLPYDRNVYTNNVVWNGYVAPKTIPESSEKHNDIRRCTQDGGDVVGLNTVVELTDDDQANFSDDSLDDVPPPPPTSPPPTQSSVKRSSIAWEVPLDIDSNEAVFTPGSTKVVGRRRRKSIEHYSSAGSLSIAPLDDDWPDPPADTEYLLSDSVTSDADIESLFQSKKSINSTGTYIIRKRNKNDKRLMSYAIIDPDDNTSSDVEYSPEELKELIKDGFIDGINESPPDFHPPKPPTRVMSLPNILDTSKVYDERSPDIKKELIILPKSDKFASTDSIDVGLGKQSVAIQVSADFSTLNKEISGQSTSVQTDDDLKYYDQNLKLSEILDNESLLNNGNEPLDSSIEDLLNFGEKLNKLEKRKELKLEIAREEEIHDPWVSVSEIPGMRKVSICEKERMPKNIETAFSNIPENLEIPQHQFGPLPPSPVEEMDEYSEILQPEMTKRSVNGDQYGYADYRRNEIPSYRRSSRPPDKPVYRDSSLKTRSVDAGYTRNHRGQFTASRRDVPVERRTLPTDLPGTSHRRPAQKKVHHSPRDEIRPQVSCSLPETPIFARGCDIPRTPLRRAMELPTSARNTPRLNGIQTAGYMRGQIPGTHGCLSEAMAGTELLRMTGPGRGWYPRHRQPRPASVEHLDRLASHSLSPGASTGSGWDTRDSRKPLTLPPNLSPKFFQRSPREALRRVTSLLIRKGGSSSKESKSKDVLSSSVIGPHGDFGESSRQQKRGFFRNFWKKSRHYSLDQQ